MPRVSLLVPVYNRAELLRECLDSALAQTMTDIEVVVVDGASTDGTWDVCRQYAERDPRVRIVREDENGGPVPGWSRCLQEARGAFGTFVWSDDLIRPTFVEDTLSELRPEVGFVYSAAEIGSVPGTGRIAYRHSPGPFPSADFIRGSLAPVGGYPVSPACAMFRLDDLRAAITFELPTSPPTDLRPTGAGSDMLFYLLTAERYRVVVAIDSPLAFFRDHPGSISVDGRGGQVIRSYATTRAWYARTRGLPELQRRVVVEYRHRLAKAGRAVSLVDAMRDCRAEVGRLSLARDLIADESAALGHRVRRRANQALKARHRARRWAARLLGARHD